VRKHDDFIALGDFPPDWSALDITVEVEAKAKEVAIAKLQRALQLRAARRSGAMSLRRATGVSPRRVRDRSMKAVEKMGGVLPHFAPKRVKMR